jgi:predicted P-loop ATPase
MPDRVWDTDPELRTEAEAERKKHRRAKRTSDKSNGSVPPSWGANLILTNNGTPKPLLANAITAFREAPAWAGILAFDAFHQRTVLRGAAPWMADPVDEVWASGHDVLAADWLQHKGISVSPDIAGQSVETVARERRFHPVLDYLARCRWDGEYRLDAWAIRYLGVADNAYVRAVSARWMIGAVARVTEPGCKADCALILEGRQGLGKSSALKALAHPWFTDEVADLGTKDAAMQLAGVWILELAELDSMARGDVSRIKSFMSRTTDRYRPPYARRVVEQPRQCVFAGTVNHNEYLRDETGGRRFWPIACAHVDIDGLTAIRDQLWAEANHRYLAGETWWLDNGTLNAAAGIEQRQRYQPDAWSAPIENYIANRASISVNEILADVLHRPVGEWTQPDMNRVARCLRAIGWERRQQRVGDGREWRYYRPSPLSPE